ncbi:MAG: hypothetical protein ACREMV_09230 [Gemmatimonadales bacterium]
MRTFCDGSTAAAITALLGAGPGPSAADLERLADLVNQARRRRG